MKKLLLGAAGAMALSLGVATSANAVVSQVYDLNYYATGNFTGSSLGNITVSETAANQLTFDVLLNSGVWFQMAGGGALDDVLSFNLSGDPAVTFAFTTPSGGSYTGGGQFTGVGPIVNGVGGQGFLPAFDYGVRTSDGDFPPNNYYGSGTHLIFTTTRSVGTLSIANITSESGTAGGHAAANIYFGADVRQCVDPTSITCATGPVGATLSGTVIQQGVPEPATWAMMLFGFGGLGALLRQRRRMAIATAA